MIIRMHVDIDLPVEKTRLIEGAEYQAEKVKTKGDWADKGMVMCNRALLTRHDYELVTCRCGSDEYAYAVADGRGIYLGRCCPECEGELKGKYRPDIFDGAYEIDEPIEQDEV